MNAKKLYGEIEGLMPEKMGERIDLFLNRKKISRAEFGRGCGTSGTTSVSNYIDGKSKPNAEFIALAAKNFDLNPMWLLFGEGPMELKEACRLNRDGQDNRDKPLEGDILDLRLELAKKDRELTAYVLELARVADAERKHRDRVLAAVAMTAKVHGLASDQHLAMINAVLDPDRAIAEMESAQDAAQSHQQAVGD